MADQTVVFHQMLDQNGKLSTQMRLKIPVEKTAGYVFIPKWLLVIITVLYAFIQLALLSAVFLVNFEQRPGLYKESCFGRSCTKNLGLICSNSTCLCPTNYAYISKCVAQKTYMQQCNSNIYCTDNTNMVCLNGVCSCNSTQYWTNKTCANIVTYEKSCQTDAQCDASLLLYCNKKYGMCMCNSNRHINFF